jgi:2-polyprenyl-3-methyl-5-hydroxy-6-metoxy-1,4-benzoquinol methylase
VSESISSPGPRLPDGDACESGAVRRGYGDRAVSVEGWQAHTRYDEFAEWYEQWIGDALPPIAAHADLLPAVTGERVLDITCGQGRMSRYLAGLGAEVTGVDISAAMLSKARAAGPEGISYARADVATREAK